MLRQPGTLPTWLSTGPGPGVLVEGPTDEIKESDRGPEDDKLDEEGLALLSGAVRLEVESPASTNCA